MFSRRPGVGTARRFGFRGVGGGKASLNLADLSLGTFTRASEGSYLIAAPTDGSSAFLAWAGVNVRRIEDRGDGLGAMLLMEGSRTNYLTNSRAMTGGTATTTANQNGGPDAAGLANQINALSGQFGPFQNTPGPSGAVIASNWVRAVTGTVDHQLVVVHNGGASTGAAKAFPGVGTNYARSWCAFAAAVTNSGMETLDARDLSAFGGQTARAQNAYVDLNQLEAGTFPSSAIRTAGTSVTRAAESLSYPVGSYPDSFRTRGFRFTVAFDGSNAEYNAALISSIPIDFGDAGTNIVQFVRTGGVIKPRVLQGGVQTILGNACTWSRGQLLTVTVDCVAGTLTLAGATTGNGTYSGTPAAFAPNTLYIGSNTLAGFFGRFGLSMVAL